MGLDFRVLKCGTYGCVGRYSTYHILKSTFAKAILKMMDAKSLKLDQLDQYCLFLRDLQSKLQDPKNDFRSLLERYRADIIKADPTLLEKKTLPFRIGAAVGNGTWCVEEFDKYLKPMQMIFGPTFIEKERQGSVATFDEVIEQQLQLLVDYEKKCEDEELKEELDCGFACHELKGKIEKGTARTFFGPAIYSLDGDALDTLKRFDIIGFWWWADHSDCGGYWSTGQIFDIMQMIETLMPYLAEMDEKWMFSDVENPVAQDFYLWKLFETAVQQRSAIEFT